MSLESLKQQLTFFGYLTIRLYCTHLFLTLTKRQKLELVGTKATAFGKFCEVTSRIRARTQNENNRTSRRTLFVDILKANDRRSDVLLVHDLGHILGDGTVHAVHSEATQQHQPLERTCIIVI